MKALKFDLFGKYAFFKNHESNSVYMSYQIIPKPTLMGLLGAIIGLDGWGQMTKHNGKLEYYEVFKDSKISIIPKEPYFEVCYETINNSTGMMNNGECANIKRQILQNPYYTIVIQKDSINEEYYNQLRDMLMKGESKYRLCLGNNNYTANISNVEEISIEEYTEKEEIIINSIFKECIAKEIYEESEEDEIPFRLHLNYPTKYNTDTDYGHFKENIILTNYYIDVDDSYSLYKWKSKILFFI